MHPSKWPVLIRPRLAGFETTGDNNASVGKTGAPSEIKKSDQPGRNAMIRAW
jgi:hypothetical protein